MVKLLTEIEIETIVALIRRGEQLPNKYKDILFDSDVGDDVSEAEIQKAYDKTSLGQLLCASYSKMVTVFNIIQKVANKDIPVLRACCTNILQ